MVTLLFIITQHFGLNFSLLYTIWNFGGLLIWIYCFLNSELFNTVAVDVELFMAKFILSEVFVSRKNWLEISKDALVWCFQISQQIVNVQVVHTWWMFVRTILGLSSTWRLISIILSYRSLSCLLHRLCEQLLRIVLRFCMLREVFWVFIFNYQIQISKLGKCTLTQQFKFSWPNNSYSHIFSCISNNCTS